MPRRRGAAAPAAVGMRKAGGVAPGVLRLSPQRGHHTSSGSTTRPHWGQVAACKAGLRRAPTAGPCAPTAYGAVAGTTGAPIADCGLWIVDCGEKGAAEPAMNAGIGS